MALTKQIKRSIKKEKLKKEKRSDVGMYIWLFLLFVVAFSASYVGIINYKEHINPNRVYGKWIEIGAPGWDTERFFLTPDGVMKDNRYIATSFTFDGTIVSYQTGDKLVEFQILGKSDERFRRVTGGGHAASFIKGGFEHTLPKQDNVGLARRVSLAEHFKSKK